MNDPETNPEDGWEYILSPTASETEDGVPGLQRDRDSTSDGEGDSDGESEGGLPDLESVRDSESEGDGASDGEAEGELPDLTDDDSVRDSESEGDGASDGESEGGLPDLLTDDESDKGSESEEEAEDVEMRSAEEGSRSLRFGELGYWATEAPGTRRSRFEFPAGGERQGPAVAARINTRDAPRERRAGRRSRFEFPTGGERQGPDVAARINTRDVTPERRAGRRSRFEFPAGGGRKRSAPGPAGNTSDEAVTPRDVHARRREQGGRTPSPTRATNSGGRKGNVKSAEKNEDLIHSEKFMQAWRSIALCPTCPLQPDLSSPAVAVGALLMHVVYTSRAQYASTCPTDQLKKAFLMAHMRASPHQVVEPGPDGATKMWRWPDGINVQGHPTPDEQYHWCVRCFRLLFEVRGIRMKTH
jgi:hypothetical protein